MILYIILAILVFFILFILIFRNRQNLKLQELALKNEYLNTQLESKERDLQDAKKRLEEVKNVGQDSINAIREEQKHEILRLQDERKNEILRLQNEYETKLIQSLKEQEEKLESKHKKSQDDAQNTLKDLLNKERETQNAILKERFSEISNKILEEKSKSFEEKQNLSLKPLQEEIARFKQEIEKNTKDSNEKQVALKVQIEHLQKASLRVSEDANNLAKALKGDSKMQGDWGEIILERLLEISGLQQEREYFTQFHLKGENGNLRADIIIKLPNSRHIIIDSKCSLSAYERYINESDDGVKMRYLSAHLESVKSHIKTLQSKEYNNFLEGEKLDFVIMFMPIEGAFNAILKHSPDIFLHSYKSGVVIASPSTLMVILRLIHNIWSNEAKDKNFKNIMLECDRLVKKFDSFSKNMKKIGNSIENLRGTFMEADGQLITGRGSMGSHLDKIKGFMVNADRDSINQADSINKLEYVDDIESMSQT